MVFYETYVYKIHIWTRAQKEFAMCMRNFIALIYVLKFYLSRIITLQQTLELFAGDVYHKKIE